MPKVVNRSLVDQIYSVLRDRIIEVAMEPGTKIDVQRLIEEFEVSETPVRVALAKLAHEGLVKLLPRRGYFVIKLTKKDLKEIYDLRILLESYALDTAIENIDPAKLKKIYADFAKLREIDDTRKRERESLKIDQWFHLEIVRNCDNKRAQELFYRIYDFARISQKMHKRIDQDIGEHTAVIKALLEKNKEAAKRLLRQHLENAREATLKALERDLKGDIR
jgi:DNA-binding GntR family transcriptional regulator